MPGFVSPVNRRDIIPEIRLGELSSLDEYPQLINDQSTLNATTIELSVTSGSLSISWGDGSTSAVTCDGVKRSYAHTYTVTGQYTIKLTGDTERIDDLFIEGQSWLSGDLKDVLRGLLDVGRIRIDGCPFTGDIAALGGLPNLSQIRAHGTDVEGDLSVFGTVPSITQVYLFTLPGITYTGGGSLPPFGGDPILIYGCDLTESEVDDFLVTLDDGDDPNGALDISGSNAPPSATGLAAKTSLEANGWTVTVST